jgi:hypothetical protein
MGVCNTQLEFAKRYKDQAHHLIGSCCPSPPTPYPGLLRQEQGFEFIFKRLPSGNL